MGYICTLLCPPCFGWNNFSHFQFMTPPTTPTPMLGPWPGPGKSRYLFVLTKVIIQENRHVATVRSMRNHPRIYFLFFYSSYNFWRKFQESSWQPSLPSGSDSFGEGNGTPLQHSCPENPMDGGAWWAAVHGVAKSRTWLSDFTFIFHFHALEKEMATHSSVLAWIIPGTGEPGGLPSMGSHRVGHDWSDLAVIGSSDSLSENKANIEKSKDKDGEKAPEEIG